MKSGNEFLQQWQSSKNLIFFWLKTRCGKRWKLFVYDAVITNKIFIWTRITWTHACSCHLVEYFPIEGTEKNFYSYIPHTFNVTIQTPTYTKGIKRANEEMNAPTEGPDRRIKPLTGMLELRKLKLLGHVLRRNRRHPWTSSDVCHSISITQRKLKS